MTTVPGENILPPPLAGPGGVLTRSAARAAFGRAMDRVVFGLAVAGALAMVLLLVLLITVITTQAWAAIVRYGWGFFVSTKWNPVAGRDKYGVLQFMWGTLASSIIALCIGVPVSIGAAIYMVRLAPRWLGNIVSFLVELLAAIPSIAYGLWGALVMVPWLQNYAEPWLKASLRHIKLIPVGHYRHHKLAWFPASLVHGGAYGADLLAGGLILAIMITPIVTAVTRDVLRAVPPDLEQGAYGLGATWWQATRVVLNFSWTGIFGAVILGMARAVGETMAIIMVIGNSDQIKFSLFASAQTMSGLLANEFNSADHTIYRSAVFYVGLVLLVMTLLMNCAARMLVMSVANKGKRFQRRRKPKAGPRAADALPREIGPAEANGA